LLNRLIQAPGHVVMYVVLQISDIGTNSVLYAASATGANTGPYLNTSGHSADSLDLNKSCTILKLCADGATSNHPIDD
jgi:hypothetical protein